MHERPLERGNEWEAGIARSRARLEGFLKHTTHPTARFMAASFLMFLNGCVTPSGFRLTQIKTDVMPSMDLLVKMDPRGQEVGVTLRGSTEKEKRTSRKKPPEEQLLSPEELKLIDDLRKDIERMGFDKPEKKPRKKAPGEDG